MSYGYKSSVPKGVYNNDVRNGDVKITDADGNIIRIVKNLSTQERGPKWNKPMSAKVIRKKKGVMS